MAKKPIKLVQMFGELNTNFSTIPDISSKVLRTFYGDVKEILKELDSRINYEGELYLFEPRRRFLRPTTYGVWIKTFQVRVKNYQEFSFDNVVRIHNITYRKYPEEQYNWKREIIKSPHAKFLEFRPNLEITSTRCPYHHQDLINRLSDLPYIEISEEWESNVFNPFKITRDCNNMIKLIEDCPPSELLN